MARFFVRALRVETHTVICFVNADNMMDAEDKALAALNHNKVNLDVTLERHDHGDADWYIEDIRCVERCAGTPLLRTDNAGRAQAGTLRDWDTPDPHPKGVPADANEPK